MHTLVKTALFLTASNVFMMFAWYAHLKELHSSRLWLAILFSWLIALPEYILHVPGNRVGFTALSLPQLKILQEAIHLAVFIPFALLYMKQPIRQDYLFAGLCILGAVYFIFRGSATAVTPA